MKPWMEDFIRLCLSKIPDLPYRRRLAGELADHLASLSADLEAGGLTAGQAQALALERMGDPEVLSRQLYSRWCQHVRSPRYVLSQLALAWLGQLCLLLLIGSLLYNIPLYQPIPLLARISGGGDPIAPWFTPDYLLLTLAGCGLLGLLAPPLFQRNQEF